MQRGGKRRKFKKEDLTLCIMALPALLALIIFAYIPMVGLIMAFQNYTIQKGLFGSPFVGMKNFEFLFTTTDAFIITRNTVLYNLVFIIVNMIFALIFSIMLSMLRNQKGAKVMQTIYMLPYFLSWAVLGIVLQAFLNRENGLVNSIIQSLGGAGRTNWYQTIKIWPPLLVFLDAWKGVGFSTVLYLAVITGIPVEYYEASVIDGANRWQQIFHITLPHLRFVIGISIILAMGSIFRADFGLFYIMTDNSGPLYPVTDVIDTYIYRGLMNANNIGMSTAAGLYQSVVGLVMVLAANAIVTKIDRESAMF